MNIGRSSSVLLENGAVPQITPWSLFPYHYQFIITPQLYHSSRQVWYNYSIVKWTINSHIIAKFHMHSSDRSVRLLRR